MAHPITPPRQTSSSRPRAVGLVTPSTPRHLSRTHQKECPDAPFLPANMFPLPSSTTTTLRTSPRTKKGDPTKSHVRTRTTTGDRGTIIMPGIPPTPAETPVQKRQREQEMKRRTEQEQGNSTRRRLFPLPNVTENLSTKNASAEFEIFTDSMHREPLESPNNPFAFGYQAPQTERGVSPLKRKRDDPPLGPDEMMYTFRGKRFVRKVARNANGDSWRDTIKPVRLFQKEINQINERQRKRRRIATEDVEEVDTEEEDIGSDNDVLNNLRC